MTPGTHVAKHIAYTRMTDDTRTRITQVTHMRITHVTTHVVHTQMTDTPSKRMTNLTHSPMIYVIILIIYLRLPKKGNGHKSSEQIITRDTTTEFHNNSHISHTSETTPGRGCNGQNEANTSGQNTQHRDTQKCTKTNNCGRPPEPELIEMG